MATNMSWTNSAFYCVQTELSPAMLVHSQSNYLGVFTGLGAEGSGAPSHIAFLTRSGPRPFKNGARLPAGEMDECWLLLWFAGAKGWTNWDSPWAVFLQHRPSSMSLDSNGLHLEFGGPAGDVVLLPLYGYYKPPPLQHHDPLAKAGLPSKKIETWKWSDFLPRDVLMRVRYWASALREFPIYCEDSFRVDWARETVTIRQRIHWRSIQDDWKTRHLKLAPVSPPLALAAKDRQFPVEFSRRVMDLDMFTPYGTYMAIESQDQYEATFKVLSYVCRAEVSQPLSANAPAVARAALQRLRQTADDKFPSGESYRYDHGGLNNFCWAAMGDLWYAKALPHYDPGTRERALGSLRRYFHEDVLVTNRFKAREYPAGSGRVYQLLEGPGIGSWGVLGDAGKFSANLLETIWAYAHFSGDRAIVKERWPLIRQLFTTPAETRWVGFGRDAIAELGDEAAPALAIARLAYLVGDLETSAYACSIFARELVHLYVKQRGADYFRKHQPWHSNEMMDEEVYLTNLWGETAGWQIDGPGYPNQATELQFVNRWVRFKNEDVARFYRDYLPLDVRREMDLLTRRWNPERRWQNNSHIMPSLVQLRSLLLNEPPSALSQLAKPEQFSGPASGVIASCLAVLRTAQPLQYERVIPARAATEYLTGVERDVAGPNPFLLQTLETHTRGELHWPAPAFWKSWRHSVGNRWHFGQVRPQREGSPTGVERIPLNWNTQVLAFSAP